MAVNHEAHLIENVTNLMGCESFNDVRITLNNGVQVEANKVILSVMSPFFKNQLYEKQKSANSASDKKFLEVDLDISSTKEMLELVVKYFYTGKMNFDSLPLKDLFDLLNLLLFLEEEEEVLSTVVEEFIINKIKKGGFLPEKLLILSSIAEAFEFDIEVIVSTMLSFLSQNICDVSKLPEVKYISCEFLKNLVNEEDVDVAEVVPNSIFFARFETVRSWLASNDVNEDVRMKLISMFDLKKFTTRQLTSTVKESELFSESSILDVLSKTVIDLQNEVEEYEVTTQSNRQAICELNKNVKMLKETIQSNEEKITSMDRAIEEANEKVKQANQKVRKASEAREVNKELNLKVEKLQNENEWLSLKLSQSRGGRAFGNVK